MRADGYFYDDLEPGLAFPVPTAVTIDAGLAATYRAIAGDALPLSLSTPLTLAVTGSERRLVNPALVMHLSIGASTVATRNVVANLFYRNVVLHRPVFEGETLTTTTSVAAMSDARPKPGTAPRGKALLSIASASEAGPVLDYERCPLLPCRGTELPGRTDDFGDVATDRDRFLAAVPEGWNTEPLGPPDPWTTGETRTDPLRDAVDSATGLVRLTNNLAAVHRDADRSPYDTRLVYGGHAVALAQASLVRILSGFVTLLGWVECNHVGPVFEGDTLQFAHTLESSEAVAGGRVLFIRTTVDAHRDRGPGTSETEGRPVLDWRSAIYAT